MTQTPPPRAAQPSAPAAPPAVDQSASAEMKISINNDGVTVTGPLSSAGSSAGTVQAAVPAGSSDIPDNLTGVVIAVTFIVFIGFPLTLAFVRRMWKRSSPGTPDRPSPQSLEDAERLRRIESTVEAMAIELERISEGQRFVTRLMSEAGGGRALPAGQGPAEPVPVAGRVGAAPVAPPAPGAG